MRVVVFDGTPNQRSKIVQKVRNGKIDLLLATYDRVGHDYGKEREYNGYGHPLLTLFDASYHRIIADEAHEIRNPLSKKSKGTIEIAKKALYRLAMTGTPLVNSPMDVYPLLAFVGLNPLDEKRTFNELIANPIQNKKKIGLNKLRMSLGYVAMRRTKAVVDGLVMADKTMQLVKISFPDGQHKEVYEHWFNKTKQAFLESETCPSKEIAQQKFAYQIKLRLSCASGSLAFPEEMDASNFAKAPKIFAMLQVIDNMEVDEKAVVFSQWNAFLDIAAAALKAEGHNIARIDGSMSIEARAKAMKQLNEDPSVRIILCSLKAGGVGINLTRASVVLMMDPWWNDATEMQACDRVHRVGQTRPVKIYRFVMKDSIEEKMITNIQQAKSKLGKGAMAHLTAEELKLAKIATLKELFGVGGNGDEDDEGPEWM